MNAKEYLFACASSGEEANFETQFKNAADRVIEAKWIRHLLLAISESHLEPVLQPSLPELREATVPVLRTLRARGACIRGVLDLKCCGSAYHPLPSLSLQRCHFDAEGQLPSIDLSNAYLCSLDLAHSRFTQLRANGMHVEGSVDLNDVRSLHEGGLCWCKLAGAFIQGHLLLDAVDLRAPTREKKNQSHPFDEDYDFFELNWCLNLYMCEIGGSIMVRKSARIEGGFLLDCAHVKGDVRMDSATITCRDRSFAVAIERSTIGGNLTLACAPYSDPMGFEGIVWLWQTYVGGSFSVQYARLHGVVEDQTFTYPIALYAGFMKVNGAVTIEDVHAQGLVSLLGMEVGSYMKLHRVTVSQGASKLPPWFRTPGWMADTQDHTRSLALDLRTVQVATTLSFRDNEICGGMDLTGSCCKTLDDDETGYHKATPVVIDGLVYERLEHFGSQIGEDFDNWRLTRWLPTQVERYVPQPFVQLAHVLSRHGDDTHARDVLVNKAWLDAKRNWYIDHHNPVPMDCGCQLWQTLRLWMRRTIYVCFILPYGACFDFGLSPGKALFTLISAILFGWLAFGLLNENGMMVVAQTPVAGYVSDQGGTPKLVPLTTTTSPGNVPCSDEIRPLVYATDVFIPLVDLREESKCDINATVAATSAWFVTACRFFKAAYALLGWVVTTLSLLTFSGVMRHRLTQD